ncbi:MAG: hypothetical protein ACOC12_00415 [Bacteroidota bacterium]
MRSIITVVSISLSVVGLSSSFTRLRDQATVVFDSIDVYNVFPADAKEERRIDHAFQLVGGAFLIFSPNCMKYIRPLVQRC